MTAPMTLEEFLDAYPEFRELPAAQVTARLEQAARRTPPDVWGELTAEGHGWLAAHMLSSSAYGRDEAAEGTTTYARERHRLERVVGTASASRVT